MDKGTFTYLAGPGKIENCSSESLSWQLVLVGDANDITKPGHYRWEEFNKYTLRYGKGGI